MKIGKRILVTDFGSTVYGTRVPSSDRDLKGLFIPTYEDILLQRAGYTSFQEDTKKDKRAKNTSEDLDMEWFTLQAFIRLCSEGQSLALDLLFTPDQFWKDYDPLWTHLVLNRSRLLCKKVTAIVGYCRQQAAKYGIKGSRLAAVKHVLQILKEYPSDLELNEVDLEQLKLQLGSNKHISFVYCRGPDSREELHLEVCNRKVPMHARFKYATEVFQRIYNEYGHRALLAEKNEGVDWKALMHAVRVAKQAKELLSTGVITFPRPEKELLLDIRQGRIPYHQAADLIEKGLEDVEALTRESQLPEEIDKCFWDSWLVQVYGEYVSNKLKESR
jgi:predicted nucleotidyltransferase